MTYVVTNRVFVNPGFEYEFENRFKNRAGQIDKQRGFVLMQVLKPVSENTPYAVMTHWESEDYFQQWLGSEDFKLAHQNPMIKEAFSPGGGIEQYEVVVSS